MPYIWLGVIIFAAVSEINMLAFVSACFIPGAFTAFALSLTGLQVWLQVFIFFIITLILLVLSRTILKKIIKFNNAGINLIIGRNAIVTEEINNYKNTGTVRINGFLCAAQSDEDDVIYESGLIVTIIYEESGKVICAR